MRLSAAQIALIIQGKIEGNPDASVETFGKIEEAREGQLTFLANPKYEDHLYTTEASVVIVNASQELRQSVKTTLIRVPDAYSAFATLLAKYQEIQNQQMVGIQQPSYISDKAKMGNHVFIGAFSYISENVHIGNNVKIFPHVYLGPSVIIGDNTILYPGVRIYHSCKIGANVAIHAGTVIGGDGFGFAPQSDGTFKKVPQIGNVVVEDNVEIGSNATIDRATIGSTIIKKGAKLDNLIQIAHNAEIGENTVIAAQSGISGSTKIGNNVMMGGQAGIVGHISIADGTRINAQSGVTKSVKTPNAALSGSPAFDYTSTLRSQAIFRNLPELEKRISDLEQVIKQLLAEKESIS